MKRILALCAMAAMALSAQTFTTLFSFDGKDGGDPQGALIQATDGNFYGTTSGGGTGVCTFSNGCGTVFRTTASGALTTLYNFCSLSLCADGRAPEAGLVQATNGYLYGTTSGGGAGLCTLAGGCGTVFRITLSGALTTLYNFCSQSGCADGSGPAAGLVQAADGYLYGTTYAGGADGGGTVFKITPSGALTTLYSFCSQTACTDGENPQAPLLQATDGIFYGTASQGGANPGPFGTGGGTVFQITASGALTTLYSFCAEVSSDGECTDGQSPVAGLVQATNGDLYGTTESGGPSNCGNGCGTVFRIAPSGTLTRLYSFGGGGDGANPEARIIQATDGNFYGTTVYGGSRSKGTVFEITPSGTLTTLYNFCPQTAVEGCVDGKGPFGVVQGTNGEFYGTTEGGGVNNDGAVFSLSTGLGPFVETSPTSGPVGFVVKILGTDLTGATSVTFNGTAATFTVVSASLIVTTVPSGATTGTVQVVTPTGTLSSNLPFRVL